jgi:hypothetical protein
MIHVQDFCPGERMYRYVYVDVEIPEQLYFMSTYRVVQEK